MNINNHEINIDYYLSGQYTIAELFKHYPKLMVVRVDLHYSQPWIDSISHQDMKRDMTRLLSNNRRHKPSLFQHFVGYIWRLEYGERKGWHAHCLFFFDGKYVRQDISYADMIIHYWREVITRGYGHGYNCNMVKNHYSHCGIGLIHRDNAMAREFLERDALGYLCKYDPLVSNGEWRDAMGRVIRTFFTSQLTRSWKGNLLVNESAA